MVPRKGSEEHIIPTPYADLNQVLHDLIDSVQAVLGDQFVGAYLHGSFAVGDFDQHSDVDFVIVVEEDLSANEVQALQSVHPRIFALDCPWAQHLEGSYFPKRVLRHLPDSDRRRYDFGPLGANAPLWYLNHGSSTLILSDHDDTLLVRSVLLERGVVLAGPDPATLIDPIPGTALRQEILTTMQGWGEQLAVDPEPYNNRFFQTFIVLSYCRMLHDLYTGHPGSKLAGAEWAKAHLDPSWAGLIDRTWAGRPNPKVSVRQSADPADFQATLEFVRYILRESHAFAKANQLE